MKRFFVAFAAIGVFVFGAHAAGIAAPAPTTSRYVQTLSYNTLYNEGCSMGSAGLSGVVVLDFGQPWDQNGVHGVYTLGSFWASPTQVEADAEAYLDGFWNCSGPSPFLHLSIGQSNYGSEVGYAEGQTWGNVVNAVNSYISTKGYGSQEAARGGFDSEPGWSTFSTAANQVNGYASTTSITIMTSVPRTAAHRTAVAATAGATTGCGTSPGAMDRRFRFPRFTIRPTRRSGTQ